MLHGKTSTFIDDFGASDDEWERQACEIEARCLIPDDAYARLKGLDYRRGAVVTRFAEEIGIAPGSSTGACSTTCSCPTAS